MTALHALCAAIAAHEPGLFELIYERLVYQSESKDGMNGQAIVIVAAVEEIDVRAFEGCTSLVAVMFPNCLRYIGSWAFTDCTNLVAVDLPASLKTIGGFAFEDCTSLVAVEFPAGLQVIGQYAFGGCTSLEAVELPEGLQGIREGAFPEQTQHLLRVGL